MEVIRRQVMSVVLVDNVWTFGIDLGILIELSEFSFMKSTLALILVLTMRLYGVNIRGALNA